MKNGAKARALVKVMPPEPVPAPPTAVDVPPGPPPELSELELVPVALSGP